MTKIQSKTSKQSLSTKRSGAFLAAGLFILILLGVTYSMVYPFSFSSTKTANTHSNTSMKGFGFTVFGKVQGVYFRKYTQKKALELQLHGWVQNTPEGTVRGQVIGTSSENLKKMRSFLEKEGSPKSRIDRVDFTDLTPKQVEKLFSETKQDGFVVLKTPRRH